jgi:CRP-like cAMP-binding protein
LINNTTRGASVITITDCELAAINKKDYDKLIMKIEQKKV